MQGVKLGATCTCTVNVQCSDNGHYLVEEQTLHNSTNIYHKQNWVPGIIYWKILLSFISATYSNHGRFVLTNYSFN